MGPVETKVKAGAGGASAGATLALLADWLLDRYVFHGAGVPAPVEGVVLLAVTTGLAAAGSWLAGYNARHTSRPDLGRS